MPQCLDTSCSQDDASKLAKVMAWYSALGGFSTPDIHIWLFGAPCFDHFRMFLHLNLHLCFDPMPNELNTKGRIDTDGHYCSPGRFIGHSGFIRCQYFLFVGLLIRHSILSMIDLVYDSHLAYWLPLEPLCFLAFVHVIFLSV